MRECRLQILVVVKEEKEGYSASCPDLGCIHVYGDNREEAFVAAKDAVQVYLDMSITHGDPIPIGILRSQRGVVGWLEQGWDHITRNRSESVAEVNLATA